MDSLQTIFISMNKTMEEFHGIVSSLEKVVRDSRQLVKVGSIQQTVIIVVRALMRPVADQLPTIYQTLGENYIEKVLPSIIDEPLKSVVAQYNASQLNHPERECHSGNTENYDRESCLLQHGIG
ncbi:hypothetical protein ACS0TY_016542 [Phlomoides rotata]